MFITINNKSEKFEMEMNALIKSEKFASTSEILREGVSLLYKKTIKSEKNVQ